MNDQQLLRYSRHILLPQLGIEGQQRILDSKILVVGCGGLGCAAIPFLASAGIGQLTIADDDKVDFSNLQRQTHYTKQNIGQSKVEAMARYIFQQNKEVNITALVKRLELDELIELCNEHDVVLDCSDNFATRKAINQASVITKTPLVFGSAIRFEGQLSVFDPRNEESPCYACIFDGDDIAQESCAASGVFAPLVGVIGAKQAAEALKIVAEIGTTPVGIMQNYDALDLNHYPVKFQRNPNCKVCGKQH
ncbi:HesA/MoeB/ThiF family protein [Entomomonas sp. E2T0]|uniref:HesA/MoeB/ThiF family protein n=1 Tax=Entomomonas sp. E2T0 TaxID=2930213 RepID=UPI00222832DB|nr:HesA/MoeB/ThiF family protein [Entomomonas sp. E2T0]UYZ83634.1 HesA/MoeB/ThiF family protein [Entomomonas sp. E2T0]